MEMTYEQAVEYLFQIPKFAKKTTKEHLLEVLVRLDNPHLARKSIHIAGTNGKGSTCAYMSSILQKAGFSVGMFTSPHLIFVEERFRINGKPVGKKQFLQCFHRSYQVVKAYEKEGNPHLSFFEMLFVIATLIFKEEPVDYVIYETGLGGRLDATNVLQPELTVITSIGFDHMQYLGDTIEQIAYEKAGIIKENTPVVFLNTEVVSNILEQEARKKSANIISIDREKLVWKKQNNQLLITSFGNERLQRAFKLNTEAIYQVENSTLAMLAVKAMFPYISDDVIQDGLFQMKWHCRMEEVEKNLFLDGAHNEPAICRFMESVKLKEGECGLVFGVVCDKDYRSMIRKLAEGNRFSHVILTQVDTERAVEIEKIEEEFLKYNLSYEVIEDCEQAFRCGKQWKESKSNRTLFCVGSLYLVGKIYQYIKEGSGNYD